MWLEARAADCFSSTLVLKIDGRPVGKIESRWMSESLDIHMTGRRQLVFEKIGWMGSQFVLREASGQPLGAADRSGFFSSTWDLDLGAGPARLVKENWFGSAYALRQEGLELARADRIGPCERGWFVEGDLDDEDLLLVGLVYHTILRRAAQAASAASAGS
jgi:hypothetical protein